MLLALQWELVVTVQGGFNVDVKLRAAFEVDRIDNNLQLNRTTELNCLSLDQKLGKSRMLHRTHTAIKFRGGRHTNRPKKKPLPPCSTDDKQDPFTWLIIRSHSCALS